MKRKLFIVSLIAIFFVCIFSLSAPRVLGEELSDQEKVDQEIENIYVPSTAIIDFPVVHVSVYDSVITWESSNQELLNVPQNGGWVQVTRPEEDTIVTLTVTIKNNEATASKKFEVTVLKGNTLTNTYNITYVLNGGTNNDQNPKSYKVGTEPSILAPTNGNIQFLGWYDNEEFEGEAITKLPHGLTGDYKLYAKWEEVKLTSIEVTKNPVLKYTAKEEFDATGIEVYAVYSDGSKELVDSSKLLYIIEGQSEGDLTIHGDTKEVIVSFEGFSTKVALESVELLQYNIEGLFTAQSKEYNGKSQEYTLPRLPDGLTAKTIGTAKDAGTAKVKVLFESLDKDYEAPDSIEVDLTITKAKLTVKPTDVYVTVGAIMPKFTVTFVGLLGDDDESLFGELEVSTNATDTNTLGEYKLTVKEFEAKNYEVTFQEGKLVVQLSTYTIYVPEEQLNVVYNGKNQMFTASVKDGDKVLPITDIVYEYNGKQFSGAKDAGTYEVTISYHHDEYGDGKLAVKFNIAKYEFDVNTLKFEDKALEYNGQVQNILVEGNLPEGIKVTYSDGAKDVINNKLIVATFEGTENYSFKNGVKTLEAYLTIEPKALDITMFDAIPEQDYTGKEITPVVKGSYAGVNFDMTLDFTVKYENNINEGQAKVIITAKENTNFKGTVELTFSIGKTPIVKVKDARIELEGKYTGELVSSLVTEATNGSKVDWLSTSTALSIKDGKVTTIQTNEVQVVVVYGLITYADETGQAAEYVKLEFTIPALGGTTPDVPVDPNPDDPEPDDPEPDDPVEEFPYEETDYNLVIDQEGLNQTLYFTGNLSGYYAQTSTSIAEAAIINVIKVEGGFNLYVKSTNKYINAVVNGTYINIKFEDSATSVWSYDKENNALVTMAGETKVFICAYGTYATGSLSNYEQFINSTTSYHAYLAPAKEVSEADKVAVVKDSLTLPTTTTTDLTLPTTGEYNALISWSSSNENAITSAGKVTQGTEDVTVVLTATIKLGNSEDTKEFTITVPKVVVVDPEVPTNEVEVTLTFDDVSKRTVYTTSQQVWTENGITVTNNKGSSTSNVGDYSNPARFYKSSELIISVNGKIKQIVVNCNTAAYATSFKNSVEGATLNEKAVTIILDGTLDSVKYTLSDGQVRVDSITVTYILGSTSEEPDEPVVPEKEYEIQYNGVEGATHENPTTYKEEDLPFDLKDASKEGYNFLGWYDGETQITKIEEVSETKLVLEARWEEVESTDPEEPVNEFPYENTDYNLVINQTNLNKTLYFNGLMDGYYAATSESYVTAVVVNVNKVEGGFNLYVKSTNKYINIVVNGTYNNFKYEDTPSTVWSYDKENNALVATVNNVQLFLGTKDSYATGGIYAISNVATENHYVAYLAPAKEVSEADKVAVVKDSLTLPTTTTTDLTLPTIGEYNALISWSSSNENAITSAGKVTQGTEDVTVVLTATIKLGNSEDTKEFTITVPKLVVVDPEVPEGTEKTVTTVIADYADANSWADATKYLEIKLDSVITATATGGGNTGKYYTSGEQWRLYQTESAKLTIKCTEGYKIKSITLKYASQNTGCLIEVESGVAYTVNGVEAVFTVGNTGTATNGQARVTEISVTYVSTSGEGNEEEHTHEYVNGKCECGAEDPNYEAPHEHVYVEGKCECGAEDPDYVAPEVPDGPVTTVSEDIELVFDADKTNRTSFSTSEQIWEETGLKFTNLKASSSNAVADYANPVRLYAGSSIKIECSQMTKIVFTCGSASYATALGTSIGEAATVEGSTVTVEFAEAVDSFDIAKLTAQVRVNSITVTHNTN